MTRKPLPRLTVARAEAESRIYKQIEKGHLFKFKSIPSQVVLHDVRLERSKWSHYNYEMLCRIFEDDSVAERCRRAGTEMRSTGLSTIGTFNKNEVLGFQKSIALEIAELQSIYELLDLVPTVRESVSGNGPDVAAYQSKKVLVLLEPGQPAKESVVWFLKSLGLEPIPIDVDIHDGWQLRLALQMKQAGLNVDLNMLCRE